MRSFAFVLLALFAAPLAAHAAQDRPNILWLSVEDISADLGCYGSDFAVTPHLDKLAQRGVRFTRVFAHAGVCAPARSGIITGMYPSTIGTHHMRCSTAPPAIVKCFPEYLRAAGYYCTNNSKTDYQFTPPPSAWDKGKDYTARTDKNQPFFAVHNYTGTHESRVWPKGDGKTTHDPAKAPVPPYYPDTFAVRRDRAQYADNITKMDQWIQGQLDRLEKAGLADDTIVIFWSDHGRGLTRGKRWLYDSGSHVPMIAYVPPKWRKHYGDFKPGTTNDELIAFIDFAPTMLSLAGVDIPPHMQGVAYAGPRKGTPRKYVFGARDRMDERYDLIRMCRDKRFKYLRNDMEYMTRGQYLDYMDRMPTLKEIRKLYAEGKLKFPQNQFVLPDKPREELYDTEADPHEVNNLADDPKHRETLLRMRARVDQWRKETGDVGLIPEPIFDRIGGTEQAPAPVFVKADGGTVAIGAAAACPSIEYRVSGGPWRVYTEPVEASEKLEARANGINRGNKSAKYDPARTAKQLPAERDETKHWRRVLSNTTLLAELRALHAVKLDDPAATYRKALSHDHPAMRYWGVTLLHKRLNDKGALDAIAKLAGDDSPTVRTAVGYALADWGRTDEGLKILTTNLTTGDRADRLFAANALDYLDAKAKPAAAAMKSTKGYNWKYVWRVCEKALADLE